MESIIVYRKDSMHHNRMPFNTAKSRLEKNTSMSPMIRYGLCQCVCSHSSRMSCHSWRHMKQKSEVPSKRSSPSSQPSLPHLVDPSSICVICRYENSQLLILPHNCSTDPIPTDGIFVPLFRVKYGTSQAAADILTSD